MNTDDTDDTSASSVRIFYSASQNKSPALAGQVMIIQFCRFLGWSQNRIIHLSSFL